MHSATRILRISNQLYFWKKNSIFFSILIIICLYWAPNQLVNYTNVGAAIKIQFWFAENIAFRFWEWGRLVHSIYHSKKVVKIWFMIVNLFERGWLNENLEPYLIKIGGEDHSVSVLFSNRMPDFLRKTIALSGHSTSYIAKLEMRPIF